MNSRDRFSNSGLPADIEAAAVHWLGLRDSGQMTPVQEAAFASWLEADERHAAAFVEADQVWNGLDALKTVRPVGEPDPDLLVPRAPAHRRRRWQRFVPATLAAAAALALAGWWWPADEAAFDRSVATRVGGHEVTNLPDGSIIRVNTDTALEVRFTPGERQVRLVRGEAHFTVAKDPARPFNVLVGEVSVQAVGTAFNVRVDTAELEVLVTEGTVRVAAPAAGKAAAMPEPVSAAVPLVTAGHRVLISVPPRLAPAITAASVKPVSASEIVRALAWQEKRLEFEDEPLARVVAEFNRYNAHKLVIADARLAEQRFGGKFRADGYEGLVRLLESSFGVTVERGEGETVLRSPPSGRGPRG